MWKHLRYEETAVFSSLPINFDWVLRKQLVVFFFLFLILSGSFRRLCTDSELKHIHLFRGNFLLFTSRVSFLDFDFSFFFCCLCTFGINFLLSFRNYACLCFFSSSMGWRGKGRDLVQSSDNPPLSIKVLKNPGHVRLWCCEGGFPPDYDCSAYERSKRARGMGWYLRWTPEGQGTQRTTVQHSDFSATTSPETNMDWSFCTSALWGNGYTIFPRGNFRYGYCSSHQVHKSRLALSSTEVFCLSKFIVYFILFFY